MSLSYKKLRGANREAGTTHDGFQAIAAGLRR